MELVENDPIDASPPLEKKAEPVEPPKKKDYKVENPKPTIQKESKEFPGLMEVGEGEDKMTSWEIKIGEGDWRDAVMLATKTAIELTQTSEDVQSIYRVNKTIYDRLKSENPTDFAELLDLFKARKEELK